MPCYVPFITYLSGYNVKHIPHLRIPSVGENIRRSINSILAQLGVGEPRLRSHILLPERSFRCETTGGKKWLIKAAVERNFMQTVHAPYLHCYSVARLMGQGSFLKRCGGKCFKNWAIIVGTTQEVSGTVLSMIVSCRTSRYDIRKMFGFLDPVLLVSNNKFIL